MKLLIVCSGNEGYISPFISEQVASIIKLGIDCEYFLIQEKGIKGYLKSYYPLKKKINQFMPDLIHAHYGLCGFLVCLIKKRPPLIITYHGSDINLYKNKSAIKLILNPLLSYLANRMADASLFVNKRLIELLRPKKYFSIIPCAVDLDLFYPIDNNLARNKLKLQLSNKYILFSSSFSNPVKNYSLAKSACNKIDAKVIELDKFSREEVNLLLNACDVALLTSLSEGSPQFIKEAMACNCPIVSTDVGDVRQVIGNTEGCYICSYNPADVVEKIKLALSFSETKGRTNGRQCIIDLGLDSETIANKIIKVYENVLFGNK